MQKRIFSFIKKKYLCTLSCCSNNVPWANTFYYIFDEENQQIIYITSDHTFHSKAMRENPNVAGTIFSETKFNPSLQGVQFTGTAHQLEGEEEAKARILYKQEYQHQIIDTLSIWAVSLEYIRMIDHTLGFLNTIEWRANQNPDEEEIYSLL